MSIDFNAQREKAAAGDDPMIVIDDVSMAFNVANEQLNSLKEYFIKAMRHELFFREFKALKNISVTVQRGDVYGIVGTNGSGKSTLLKIIAGVLEPTSGTCAINGTIAPLIELGAGFDPELTARENVYLNGSLLGYSKQFIDESFDSIVEFAEVGDFIDMPLKNYSSGMTARIAFAIATATVPDILVVDEALSVGDFLFQDKCERRINELVNDHGTTLLFVSHSIEQVERVCEKALWIEKGVMRMNGPVDEVCEAYRNLQ
ncbi:ABC transporter ATP-binding protein [Eggerthellaceae bacterium zg-1084]|uniref:ABC transporter ATP-binding protein n=1 Tax=Berryella wangjianweii TaxID=2734634 RepID=A0A6M8J4Q0_9ACTN|nr:ABC transporter ATP-binding protein [Berryella wangjianweii]NPD31125.1 ABC transporter ATP-binding protein [Berryella wangjianweii]NPD32566.1 ABC transporter ATP-binding protein [Eggerthellaceae bacterium zg-997]QKF06688.1 ABC transporter ATP-binding protein [Berryella wangjianweii]